MPTTSVWRVAHDKHKAQKRREYVQRGRRKMLTLRDRRKLSRALTTLRRDHPNFTVMDIVKQSGIPQDVAC